MIRAGKVEEISWSIGTWLILDIGFSAKNKSCALSVGDDNVDSFTFSEATSRVVGASQRFPLLNLVIEAPLSVAFDKAGNPTRRNQESKNGKNRFWYVGPGSAVLVASMYLMRELLNSHPVDEVRLFEGFVSYKDKDKKSDHLADVKSIRNVIKSKLALGHCVISPEDLKVDPDDIIKSAFRVMNFDPGVPPVIVVGG